MKKLTKKERNRVYKKVYEKTFKKEWYNNEFICNRLSEETQISEHYIFYCFPEFELLKPNYHEEFDAFKMRLYNPEIEGGYGAKEFTPI